ncbi:MAG: CapA family protein [Myxococcales bacterium]|nr:CapA family protein [Myxococcales bacterium]
MRATKIVLLLAVTSVGVGVVACTSDPHTAIAQPSALDAAAPVVHNATPIAASKKIAETISMVFVGDVMFGRYKGNGFAAIPADTYDVFAEVAPALASDFTMANLETPVMWDPPRKTPYDAHLRFVTTPARVAAVKRAGIDHVSLANNHYWDMKLPGVEQSPLVLQAAGITPHGAAVAAGELFVVKSVDVKGWRVGVLAAATLRNYKQPAKEPALPWANGAEIEAALVPVIAAAAPNYDVLIVALHWGAEYQATPATWQVRAAHAFIDAGADAVIGHHPHVLQGMELYKGRVIAYSLGNFVFDNVRHPLQQSAILRLQFRHREACLARAEITPVVVVRKPHFHPTLATDKLATAVRHRLTSLSSAAPFRTIWSPMARGEALELELANCPITSSP